jgi:hypothetical protein
MKRRKGQISLEYILVIAFTFAIIIPGIYFFFNYSQSSVASFNAAQYDKLGQEIVATAVQTIAQGKESWLTLDLLVPTAVDDIVVADGGRELVIRYRTPHGISEAVFFSDDVVLSGIGGADGTIYQREAHGGRVSLKFAAETVNGVLIEEDTGNWIPPQSAECSQASHCPTTEIEGEMCWYNQECKDKQCVFESKDEGPLQECPAGSQLKKDVCRFWPDAGKESCVEEKGWVCAYTFTDVDCYTPSHTELNGEGLEDDECWYGPETGEERCKDTGCSAQVDRGRSCDLATCPVMSIGGWDEKLCVNSPPELLNLVLNTTDSPADTTDANLTAWPIALHDPDSDPISLLYDWRIDNISLAVANMNFDVNDSAGINLTKDYTTTITTWGKNNAKAINAKWCADCGRGNTGAYYFDGAGAMLCLDTRFGICDNTDANPTFDNEVSARTVLLWYKAEGGLQGMLYNEGGGSNGMNIYLEGSQLYAGVWSLTNSGPDEYLKTATTGGVWHHVAIVFDYGSKNTFELYYDGVLKESVSVNNTLNAHAADDALGTAAGGTKRHSGATGSTDFKGWIDNFIVFDRALSAQQIKAIYNDETAIFVSEETVAGEKWNVCLTPNDGQDDGIEYCSNDLEIQAPAFTPCQLAPLGDDYLYCREMSIGYESLSPLSDYQVAVDMNPLHQGLIGSWHLDEGSGTFVKDRSAKKHDGTTIASPTWDGGINGNALSFTGPSTQYVTMGNQATHQQSEYTVSAWVNIPASISNTQTIVGRRSSIWSETNYMLRVVSTSGTLQLTHVQPDNDIDSVVGKSDLRGAKWTHVAATYNGTHQEIFVNGVSEGATPAGDPETGGNQELRIGHNLYDNNFFEGTIDEVRLYDRGLTIEEINAEYCTGRWQLRGSKDYPYPTWCDDYIKTYTYYGEDYRFTETDGTLLSHWHENDDLSWVKIPSITALMENKFYLYYGNKTATAVSNPDATFILYDDFNDGLLDTDKWTVKTELTGTVTETNGYVGLRDTGIKSVAELHSKKDYSTPIHVKRVVKIPSGQFASPRHRFTPNPFGVETGIFDAHEIIWGGSTGTYVPADTWFLMENIHVGTSFTWNLKNLTSGASIYQNAGTSSASTWKLSSTTGDSGGSGSGWMQIDEIIVRNYAEKQPTVTMGAEQG